MSCEIAFSLTGIYQEDKKNAMSPMLPMSLLVKINRSEKLGIPVNRNINSFENKRM